MSASSEEIALIDIHCKPRVGVGLGRLLSLLMLPVMAMLAGLNGIQQVLVSGQIEMLDPVGKVKSLALLTMLTAISSMFGFPLSGALPDRTRSRLGNASSFRY